MKRCPECRRDYFDDSLLYCLDDGSALLDGPASGNESATAILSEPPALMGGGTAGEAATRPQIYGSATSPQPGAAAGEKRSARKGRTLIIVAIAGILIAGITFVLYRSLRRTAVPFQSVRMTKLTNIGKVGSATISPDGKYVAYSAADDAGLSSLWIRHVATASNVQIVPPAGPDVNFGQTTFSPDGNYLYYIRSERNLGNQLHQVPVLGGTSKKLLDNVSRISFSPDGQRFAFQRRVQEKQEDAVILTNSDGTGEQVLATRKFPGFLLGGVAWSPDGKTIACPVGGFEGGYYRSFLSINVEDGTSRPLTERRWNNVERADWLSDGSGVIVTAQEHPGENFQVWRISYPAGEAGVITSDLSSYHNVSITADSSAMVAVPSDVTANIWVAPFGSPNDLRQVTSSLNNGQSGVAWTADGRIVYGSRPSGKPELWSSDPDGRNQKQIADVGSAAGFPCGTQDGRFVVFDAVRGGSLQVWRANNDGSLLTQLTAGPGFQPACAPDSRTIFYTTFGPGGFSIWKVSIDGGEPVQVIDKYALTPSVSPDGKLIACNYVDQATSASKVALFPSEGGEPLKVFDSPAFGNAGSTPVRWMPDGRAFTYLVTRGGVSNIWLQPIDGAAAKQITDYKTGRIFWFDISRDGKQFAFSRGTVTSDVVLLKDSK
jgi:Tol biopolymer transport system component